MNMSKPRVMSAAELDALSPEERERHFAESIVTPDQLPDDYRQRIIDRQNRLIAEREQRAS